MILFFELFVIFGFQFWDLKSRLVFLVFLFKILLDLNSYEFLFLFLFLFFYLVKINKLILWYKTKWFFDSYVPHNCYWHFEARKASLIVPGGVLFPKSNGETQIQWLGFFLKFWAEQLPLTLAPYIKRTEKLFLHFYKPSNFQRYQTPEFLIAP